MSKIVTLTTYYFWSDWTDFRKVDIDIEEWVFFEVDFRCDSWHLIGHKYNKQSEKWEREELSNHGCFIRDLAEFIAEANTYPDKSGFKRNRVSRFNNLHYSNEFYVRLNQLLNLVDKFEKEKSKGESDNA